VIISVYNTHVKVFIMQVECVYCAVRTDFLNTFQVLLSLQSAEAWDPSKKQHCFGNREAWKSTVT
jgi:hypothetical protein